MALVEAAVGATVAHKADSYINSDAHANAHTVLVTNSSWVYARSNEYTLAYACGDRYPYGRAGSAYGDFYARHLPGYA